MRGSVRVVDHLLPDDRVGPTHIDDVPEPSYGTVLGEQIVDHGARTPVAGAADAGGQAVPGRASVRGVEWFRYRFCYRRLAAAQLGASDIVRRSIRVSDRRRQGRG